MRVGRGLATVVDRLRDASDVLLSKGGITSAVNVRDGLGAERAQIVGPVAPGVSLWLAHERRRRRPSGDRLSRQRRGRRIRSPNSSTVSWRIN